MKDPKKKKNDIRSSYVDAVNSSITLRDLNAPSFQLRPHHCIILFMSITQKNVSFVRSAKLKDDIISYCSIVEKPFEEILMNYR
jgi:hypothetical protein